MRIFWFEYGIYLGFELLQSYILFFVSRQLKPEITVKMLRDISVLYEVVGGLHFWFNLVQLAKM